MQDDETAKWTESKVFSWLRKEPKTSKSQGLTHKRNPQKKHKRIKRMFSAGERKEKTKAWSKTKIRQGIIAALQTLKCFTTDRGNISEAVPGLELNSYSWCAQFLVAPTKLQRKRHLYEHFHKKGRVVNRKKFGNNPNLPFRVLPHQLSPRAASADFRSVLLSLTEYKGRHCQLNLAGDSKAAVPHKTLDE